jgi:PEP-CTERM motif
MKKIFAVLALVCASMGAQAAVVINNAAVGSTVNDFNAAPAGAIAGLLAQTGANYGERFAGQTLATGTGFDVLSGAPTNPLTLLANATLDDNIGLVLFNAGNVIYGDLGGSVGEGALSILLAADTDVFGLDVVGTDGGAFTIQFFDGLGGLIGSITQGVTNSYFGFSTTAGSLIRAVSITNTDPAGVGYDNVQFNARASAVPEPATLALVGLALLSMRILRRKRD